MEYFDSTRMNLAVAHLNGELILRKEDNQSIRRLIFEWQLNLKMLDAELKKEGGSDE